MICFRFFTNIFIINLLVYIFIPTTCFCVIKKNIEQKKTEHIHNKNRTEKYFWDGLTPNDFRCGRYHLLELLLMVALAIAAYQMPKRYGQPSGRTRREVLAIAKKLKIKYPQRLRIKILESQKFKDNAAVDFHGTLYLGRDIASSITSKKSKFVIGHELAHLKNRDHVWLPVSQLACVVASFYTYVTYLSIFKKSNVLILQELAKPFRFVLVSLLVRWVGFSFVKKIFSEARADFDSARLGKAFVQGGVEFCNTDIKKNRIKKSMVQKISEHVKSLFLDSHFSLDFRLKYLTWFKEWRYL